jgi:hypothetical protein
MLLNWSTELVSGLVQICSGNVRFAKVRNTRSALIGSGTRKTVFKEAGLCIK